MSNIKLGGKRTPLDSSESRAQIQHLEARLLMSVSTRGWEGPLTPGTYWDYNLNPLGTIIAHGESVVTVIGATTFADHAATEIDETKQYVDPGNNQPIFNQTFSALTPEGFITYGSDGEIYTPPRLDLPATMIVGVGVPWINSNGKQSKTDTLKSETPQRVVVPAGTFSCYVIDEVTVFTVDNSTFTTDERLYYSPGVGRVETFDEKLSQIEYELTRFHRGPSNLAGLSPSISLGQNITPIAGSRAASTIAIKVQNAGFSIDRGRATINIFTIPADGSHILVSTKTRQVIIGAGRAISVNVRVHLGSLVAGPYTTYAEVVDSSNNLVAATTGPMLTVAAPFLDLHGNIVRVTPPRIHTGQSSVIQLEIFNDGNILAKGPISMALSLSTSADGSSPTQTMLVARHIRISPGNHQIAAIAREIPVGIVPGIYYLVADINVTNSLEEFDWNNNIAISATTLTLLGPVDR